MNINQLDREIVFHLNTVEENFSAMARELATPAPDVAALRARVQRVDVLNGESHSRLAQVRALRWMRKQLLKELAEETKAVQEFDSAVNIQKGESR